MRLLVGAAITGAMITIAALEVLDAWLLEQLDPLGKRTVGIRTISMKISHRVPGILELWRHPRKHV